jgi:cyclophilin family peptidyl-prolyl cis-trans isomerase
MKRLFWLSLAVCALGAPQIMAVEKNPVVVMETSMGTIKIELFADKAPITVKNFVDYVEAKHYDGLIFHRVIDGFMIQGGGMEPGMREKATKNPIKNEAAVAVANARGTIAMARTDDPNSATAQFFINLKDNSFLNYDGQKRSAGYCAFGKVIEGMDVVDKIAKVDLQARGDHVPKTDVVIKSVTVQK